MFAPYLVQAPRRQYQGRRSLSGLSRWTSTPSLLQQYFTYPRTRLLRTGCHCNSILPPRPERRLSPRRDVGFGFEPRRCRLLGLFCPHGHPITHLILRRWTLARLIEWVIVMGSAIRPFARRRVASAVSGERVCLWKAVRGRMRSTRAKSALQTTILPTSNSTIHGVNDTTLH